MRKLLIKIFVLDFMFKLRKNTWIWFNRSALITLPLGSIFGLYFAFTNEIGEYRYDGISITLVTLLLIALYFAFAHFALFPAKYSELTTDSQKWQYGKAVKSGNLTQIVSDVDWTEWEAINKKFIQYDCF